MQEKMHFGKIQRFVPFDKNAPCQINSGSDIYSDIVHVRIVNVDCRAS